MPKLFVSNLPSDTTDQEFAVLFAIHGCVRSSKLARDLFSGKCNGLGSVEMEGYEALAAIAGVDGTELRGNVLKVGEERRRRTDRNGHRCH